MEGISFIVNDRGEKTGVVIDLKRHGKLWEEFYNELVDHEKHLRIVPLG